MEDVLEVYHRQYRDNEVLVCLDETSKQQVKETRLGRPPRPGAAASYDYEYERNGVSNLFMLFAPLEGWRRVEVTERRTRRDWAETAKPQTAKLTKAGVDRLRLLTWHGQWCPSRQSFFVPVPVNQLVKNFAPALPSPCNARACGETADGKI